MTTLIADAPDTTGANSPVPAELLDDITAQAGALDRGEGVTRTVIPRLGAAHLLGLGAPANADGGLLAMTHVVSDIASRCMSTAFSVWANRMTIEYLRTAGTAFADEWADRLGRGEVLGITGMASAFKDLAGCGTLDLTAERVSRADASHGPGDGYVLNGPIRWASNLFDDSLLVTAARTGDGGKVIVALPLTTPGVTVGKPFSLLALGSTASSFLNLEDVHVPEAQVLTHDVADFLSAVRPTFMLLQTAMCLGLARTCIDQARESLVGVNSSFATELDAVFGRFTLADTTLRTMAGVVGGDRTPSRAALLSLRLSAAESATEAAGLEIRTAGGKGYASATPASRRFREAAFIPVQSPSEGQLRWELASCH